MFSPSRGVGVRSDVLDETTSKAEGPVGLWGGAAARQARVWPEEEPVGGSRRGP